MSLEHFNDCALLIIWLVVSVTIIITAMSAAEDARNLETHSDRDFAIMPHDRAPKVTRGDGWVTVDMPHEHLSFRIPDEDEDEDEDE